MRLRCQQQSGRGTGERREGGVRVREHARQEGGGLVGAERAAGQGCALFQHPQRVAHRSDGLAGEAQHLIAGEVDDAVDVRTERAQQRQPGALVEPEARRRALDVVPGDTCAAVVEWVGVRDLRADPFDALGEPESLEEGRGEGCRMHRRPDIEPEARQ